ncbi:MAG: type 1 glutamine amidotransferase [Spirochaetales bacterium]|nr:type 1 glutamine amidotransferase [Spirochaetales bacterium]
MRRVMIFLEELYEDLEFWYPYLRMQEAGFEVKSVAPKKATYHGKHGLPAQADAAVDAVDPLDFDALVIPGGYSPDRMRRSRAMIDTVIRMHQEGKLLASICHGPWMLASAGVVRGRELTSFYSIRDDLVNAGARWVDREVVTDGRIITSRNPGDLPAFCRAIIRELADGESRRS